MQKASKKSSLIQTTDRLWKFPQIVKNWRQQHDLKKILFFKRTLLGASHCITLALHLNRKKIKWCRLKKNDVESKIWFLDQAKTRSIEREHDPERAKTWPRAKHDPGQKHDPEQKHDLKQKHDPEQKDEYFWSQKHEMRRIKSGSNSESKRWDSDVRRKRYIWYS